MRKQTSLPGYGEDRRTPIKDSPAVPKTKAKKDTRQWCRGVAGRLHKTRWMSTSEARGRLNTPQGRESEAAWILRRQELAKAGHRVWAPMEVLVCEICGKHLDWRTSEHS